MSHGRVVESSEWIAMSVPDVYFSFQYHKVSAIIERDFSQIVLLEWSDPNGTLYLPLILREIPGTEYFDATSAYGYGGPWVKGAPNVDHFIDFFESWALNNSIVCTFIRFHPLLGNAHLLSKSLPIQTIGPTVGWDLRKPRDLVAGMAKGHRKTLRKAVRAGVEARLTVNPQHIEDFVNLYQTSMSRLEADSFYHFSETYWAALKDVLGDKGVLVEAVVDKEVIAAVWCLISDDYLHFHLSGTSDEGRKLGGSVLCRVAAAEWAQQAGLSMGHFGGGVGGADSSLLAWKQKFDESSPLFEFSVAKIIHNRQVYSDLGSNWPQDGFFPPWRNPKA